MKTLLVCLLAVAAASALSPIRRSVPPLRAPGRTNPHIIGGSVAGDGQFPWQVAVTMDGSYFCGGSVISETTVMTAGHCVSGFGTWEMRFGTNKRTSGGQTQTSTSATLHEAYGSIKIVNDIAVVHLSSAISGPNIAPILLPTQSQEDAGETFAGQTARVSGWGKTGDNNPILPSDLQFVDLPVITNDACTVDYGTFYIVDTTLCCGTNNGAISTCNGDSGGPLIMDWGRTPYQIGIVSFGSSAGCESGYAAAFTRVSKYLAWVETNGGVPVRP